MNGVERGCLIIADISGYTKYMTGVELEHSTDILADLINTVVDQTRGTFTLAKLEGDAIFSYAVDPKDLTEGSSLVTTIEGCYFAFQRRQAAVHRATTCTCDACSRISTLNLKFVVHYGSFAIHKVAGLGELVGPDIIVAHRLLKNDVSKRTGINGYALFTRQCAERYQLDPGALALRPHTETYEDVGDISGWVLDLDTRWAEEKERTVVRLSSADPKVIVTELELPAPPPLVWDHLMSPAKRMAWQTGTDDIVQANQRGTRGVGTQNHCVHGKATIEEEILDWKPFRYVTVRFQSLLGQFTYTLELSPIGDGSRTKLISRLRPDGGLRQRLLMKVFGGNMIKGRSHGMARLERILEAEQTRPAGIPR